MHLAVGTGYLSLPLDAHLPPSMEYLGSEPLRSAHQRQSVHANQVAAPKVTFASLELPAQGVHAVR